MLVIGRDTEQVCEALSRALPRAEKVVVEDVFDGIAELHAGSYAAVLASVEPIADRPEAATGVLREASGGARLLVYGPPTSEPVARELTDAEDGCDQYFITPADPAELALLLDGPPEVDGPAPTPRPEPAARPGDPVAVARSLLAGEALLRAQLDRPGKGLTALMARLDAEAAPLRFAHAGVAAGLPALPQGYVEARETLASPAGVLRVAAPAEHAGAVDGLLDTLRPVATLLAELDARHATLRRLAYVDDLTGLSNGRLFREFLGRILDKAARNYFPVTLLLFDIDNFKQYNDAYGHQVGDEILKQTANLIRRCTRDHDLVARVSGDEFAVVFWEKEGPRQPRDPDVATTARVPQTPLQIANRFRRLMNDAEFSALGETGRGKLTISGGMAVYPFDAQSPEALIRAADEALMFNAKQHGKNTIALVQGENAAGHD